MRAGVVPPLFVLQVMEVGRKPEWEEERHTPLQMRGGEDGGGAPYPSTSKDDMELVPQKSDKSSVCLC